jgi:hypothetical protein
VQKLTNKKFLMRRIAMLFGFLAVFFCTHKALAQKSNCEETLNLASAEFDAGRFVGLENILKPCLDNGFSREQKVRAYLLLTQAFLILEDPKSAENSYLELLKSDPEYIANPVRDPVDVYYLSKKFTSTPIFTPHAHLGASTSIPRMIYNVNTGSAPDQISTKSVFKLGYQLGGDMDWNITERWSLCTGIAYSLKVFKTVLHDNNAASQLTATEKENWFDIPLYLKYQVDSGKIRPFAYAGVAANLLVGTKLTLDGINRVDFTETAQGKQEVSQGPDATVTFKRNFLNRSLVFGGGVKYKLGKNFVYVDVRYMAGLTNLTKNIYTTSNGKFDLLLAQYGYASSFFRLDNVSISVGFVKPLYNPRKKKKPIAGLLEKLGIKKSGK